MADPGFVPGLIGAVISELLRAAITEVTIAARHSKYFAQLLETLHSLKAFLSEVKDSKSGHMQRWLKKLEECLETAKDLATEYQGSNASKIKRLTMSRRILGLIEKIKDVTQDAGMANVAQVHSLETALAKQQEMLIRIDVAVSTLQCTHSERYTPEAAKLKIDKATRMTQHHLQGSIEVVEVDDHGDLFNPELQQTPLTAFGIEEMVSNLMIALLKEDSSSSKWIQVWGKGGAGKTLLAQKANNDELVHAHFGGHVYWLTVGPHPEARNLLRTLSSKMPGCPETYPDQNARNTVYNYARKRKMLLILDDVWDAAVLEELDVVEASTGSKILFTTRKDMLHQRRDGTVLQVRMLSPENSWKLFCSHAFGKPGENLPPRLVELARAVVDECKGLPLALKVIGTTMAGKRDVAQWEQSLKKLRKARGLGEEHETLVFERLKLSYDELLNADAKRGEKLQTAFLYFAAFKEDAAVQVEMLINYWIGEGLITSEDDDEEEAEMEGYYFLGLLIGRSLIELDYEWSNTQSTKFLSCKIHDVLRDMALYILEHNRPLHEQTCLFRAGNDLSQLPEEWYRENSRFKRISLSGNKLEELSVPLRAPALKVLLLNENLKLAQIKPDFLCNFKNLTVLDLARTAIKTLPRDISKLASLVVLELSYCSFLTTIPKSIGKLTKLEHIGMQQCFRLEVFPLDQLSNLVNLKYLNVRGCTNFWDQESHSHSLHHFSLFTRTGNEKLQGLEILSGLTKLTKLWIYSSNHDTLPESLSRLTKMRHLSASFTKLKSLPDELQSLAALQVLDLNYCGLVRLPEWLPNFFSHLETLDLRCCQFLAHIPHGLERLQELTKLDLSLCQHLKYVPEEWGEAGAFPCLAELWLTGCHSLVKLPELKHGAMRRLAYISCVDCSGLQRVPDSIKVLASLVKLDLKGCINVREIPGDDAMISLRNLEVLILSSTGLSTLPDSLARLPRLKTLMLSSCKHLEMLPARWDVQGEGFFPRLEEISLDKSGIRKLSRRIVTAPQLRKIDVSDCIRTLYRRELLTILQDRKVVQVIGWA